MSGWPPAGTRQTCQLRAGSPDPYWFKARLAVVHELQRHWPVAVDFGLAQELDRGLELVFTLAGDADGVALDLRFQLRQPLTDQLGDLARQILTQALTQCGRLAHGAFGRFFDLAVVEDLR